MMDTPLAIELIQARAATAAVFKENGFLAWSRQASAETDPAQIRRLAVRAVNTTPEPRRDAVAVRLAPLLQ
jgi:hypothetical protein